RPVIVHGADDPPAGPSSDPLGANDRHCGAGSPMASACVDRLPGRARIVAPQAGADLGRVAGKVLADDVQAELGQDRGGGLAFEEEFERGPDEFLRGDVTVPEAGGKTGRYAHLVAGARGCLDAEGAT